jgi:hypothetical protein
MSLTSYRAAPPRGSGIWRRVERGRRLRAWRRPTLPHLEVQYHWRRGFSRPSSGWDRVFGPSLWPPGRQFHSPEGRPLGRGVPGGCHVRRKKKCLWAVGAPLPALAGTGLRGRGFCRYARRLGSRPIERLVPVSSTDCSAFTSGLSTWWSSTALGETWF